MNYVPGHLFFEAVTKASTALLCCWWFPPEADPGGSAHPGLTGNWLLVGIRTTAVLQDQRLRWFRRCGGRCICGRFRTYVVANLGGS